MPVVITVVVGLVIICLLMPLFVSMPCRNRGNRPIQPRAQLGNRPIQPRAQLQRPQGNEQEQQLGIGGEPGREEIVQEPLPASPDLSTLPRVIAGNNMEMRGMHEAGRVFGENSLPSRE